ncbi:thioredoxin peroxidase dot5 [Zalaria obscura]|uniref:Thioredoxin peroxidase dot5 n=1 Tax=Zalaria obscura TaxID=2024903 RepID=A0ACC3SL80_9PEZI
MLSVESDRVFNDNASIPARCKSAYRHSILVTLRPLTIGLGTTQACLFRDSFAPLTATGLSIYGLSTDSPKANTTFKTKQNLPYTLLCDPSASLIGAIGFKKSPKGTQRGVFVVAKDGKVLAAEPGGPAPTVEVVKKLVATMGGTTTNGEKDLKKAEETAKKEEGTGAEGDSKAANTAAEVADTAEKLDG